VTKRALDGNRTGVVDGDERCRSSSDLDQEDQEEKEYENQKSVGKGAVEVRGVRNHKKDSSDDNDE
jgi:hypothetical protein